MRISDWSSDVCSSDLVLLLAGCGGLPLAVLALGREVFLVLLDVVMRIVTVGVAVAVVGMVIVPAGIAVAVRILVAIVVLVVAAPARRSDERSVGKECVGPRRSRLSLDIVTTQSHSSKSIVSPLHN